MTFPGCKRWRLEVPQDGRFCVRQAFCLSSLDHLASLALLLHTSAGYSQAAGFPQGTSCLPHHASNTDDCALLYGESSGAGQYLFYNTLFCGNVSGRKYLYGAWGGLSKQEVNVKRSASACCISARWIARAVLPEPPLPQLCVCDTCRGVSRSSFGNSRLH